MVDKLTDEQWFDQYTRIDEVLILSYAMLRQIAAAVGKPLPLPAVEKAYLESGQVQPYEVRDFTLDDARVDEEVVIDGDFLIASTDGDISGCSVRLNREQNSLIPLARYNPVTSRFYRLLLTTVAQAGKTLYLFVGREAAADTQPGTTTVSTTQSFAVIESDKDTQFEGALAQYVKADENLTGLLANNIRITGVGILSDQQLHYKLLLWYKDTLEDADLDVDEFCGEVDLDIPTYGFQIGGAGTWYHDVRNLHLDYIDADASNELHVSLINMSAAAKSADPDGNVKLIITYETRS